MDHRMRSHDQRLRANAAGTLEPSVDDVRSDGQRDFLVRRLPVKRDNCQSRCPFLDDRGSQASPEVRVGKRRSRNAKASAVETDDGSNVAAKLTLDGLTVSFLAEVYDVNSMLVGLADQQVGTIAQIKWGNASHSAKLIEIQLRATLDLEEKGKPLLEVRCDHIRRDLLLVG
jgi:hypothetical protein